MQLQNGSQLQSGKYHIIRILGQGGFGITYLAENVFFDKMVAIKEFFPKDFCGRDDTSHLTLGTQTNAETVAKLKDRFLKEAKNIAKLDHPGIVQIYDIFEENNTAYYVMDYIDGENLNEMVKRDGPLSEEKAVEYIKKVGDALDYIHSRNMTHFDVKPANIVIRKKDDSPVLIDFGLSKQYDAHGDATSTLMQGVSNGYSPLELYNAGSITTFSPQTDVYSLGATLYYLLMGSVPPSSAQILDTGLSLPVSLDTALANFIETAMQVSRSKRPKKISDILLLLPDTPDKQRPASVTIDGGQRINSEYDRTRIIVNERGSTDLTKFEDEIKSLKEQYDTVLNERQILELEFSHLSKKESKVTRSRNIAWVILSLTSISLLFSLATCSIKDNELSETRHSFNVKINELESDISTLMKTISTETNGQQVFINDIDVKNTGDSYGDNIYSKTSTYLVTGFNVLNLSDSEQVLGIKIYTPWGLSTGDSSTNGYTYMETVAGKQKGWMDISGWGSEKEGNWGAGKYRIEIWNNNKCIGKKSFTVH